MLRKLPLTLILLFSLSVHAQTRKVNPSDSLTKYRDIYDYYSQYGKLDSTWRYYGNKMIYWGEYVDTIKKDSVRRSLERKYKIRLK